MFYAPGFTKPAQAAEADDRPVHPHQDGGDDVAAYTVSDEAKAPDSVDDCLADESNEDDSEDELDEDYHGLISCFDDCDNCLHDLCFFASLSNTRAVSSWSFFMDEVSFGFLGEG